MNTQNNDAVSQGLTSVETKLKFIRSERTSSMIGFVSINKVTGQVRGVRKDDPYPKKVCLIDKDIAGDILENVLYNCTLIPMKEKLNGKSPGYIVISATPVQFRARVIIDYDRRRKYIVHVDFGNKSISYNPIHGRKESVRSIEACRNLLARRVDVKDLQQVLDDFDVAVNTLSQLIIEDRMDKKLRK